MSNVDEFLEGIRHLLEAAIVGEPVMSTGGRLPDCLASPVKRGTVTRRRVQQTPPRKPRPAEYWGLLKRSGYLTEGKLVKNIRGRIYEMTESSRRQGFCQVKIDFNLEVGSDSHGRTIYLRDLPRKVAEAGMADALMKSHLLCKFANGIYTIVIR